VNELLAAAKRGGQPVIMVRTEHLPDKSTWTLNMLQDDQGFAYPGSEQAAPLAELAIDDDTITVVKNRDDAFHRTDLAEHLADLHVDGILLCGVSTHSCIAQTATAAFARNIPCAVAQDAIASEDPELAAALLAFLHREMRQPLLDQTSAVGVLDGSDPKFP
jgi:nicotinamidase-related amidase